MKTRIRVIGFGGLGLLLTAAALSACSSKDGQTPVNVGVSGTGALAGTGAAAGGGGTLAGVAGTSAVTGAAGMAGSAGMRGTSGAGGGSAGIGAAGTGSAGTGAAGAGAGAGMGGRGGAGGMSGIGGISGNSGNAVPPGQVTFSKNVKLNDDTGRTRQTEVALATGPDGLVLAGWMDERASRVCAYSFSTDGGATWSKNVSISNTANFVGDPAVAIDGGGNMYAVCQQYTASNGSSGNIKMMTSTDKGATWSAVKMIQSAPDKPWIAGGVEKGTIFVSWLGNPGGIKRSLDGGNTWETTQSTGNIIHGTAIVPSTTGLLHVPYNLDSNRNQLRYLRSKDNGKTYEMPRDLLPDMGTFCFQCNPRQHPIVGASADPTGKYVAITWASRMTGGEGDDDVWLLYSKDGGETWTKPLRVNDNKTKSRQFESWVAVDAYGRVHVAWTDFRDNGQNETWYARSADPEKGFEPNIQVTDGRGSGSTDFLGDYKGIAVQGADVLVVWQDTRNDVGDIYFARAVGAAGPPAMTPP
jgi:hypothetical protein